MNENTILLIIIDEIIHNYLYLKKILKYLTYNEKIRVEFLPVYWEIFHEKWFQILSNHAFNHSIDNSDNSK